MTKDEILYKTLKENGFEEFVTKGSGFWETITEAMTKYSKQQLPIHSVIERLPIGTEVTIIDHEDWGEQRGVKKTITGYTDFGKKQGYLLDGVGIYLIEDFEVNVL